MKGSVLLCAIILICGISLPSLSGQLIYPYASTSSGFILAYTAILTAIFLLIAVVLRQKHLGDYWQILFAFFIASLAMLFDLLINVPATTPTGLALDMLASTALIVSTIIILTRVSGNSFASIFLQKGNLKLGIIIGLIGFLFFALTALPAAQYLFGGRNLSLDRVIAWLPWILPIVLLNGFREELLYRGLFLKKFQLHLGLKTSNLLQAIIFSLSHSVAGVGLNAYTPYIWALLIFTFVLGLIWGYVMQRTNSIVGSMLFHAGSDIPIFLGIFSNTF
jgi:membrane protease YdiL (CAAX protease family)